jgi:hypothetical protein
VPILSHEYARRANSSSKFVEQKGRYCRFAWLKLVKYAPSRLNFARECKRKVPSLSDEFARQANSLSKKADIAALLVANLSNTRRANSSSIDFAR